MFLGDSLTAGYGSGFDDPATSPACGGGTPQNDVANAYGAVLCDKHFGASCAWVARSGVGLIYPPSPGLPALWPTTLGSFTGQFPWNASSWVPDAVVINIGENDWKYSNKTRECDWAVCWSVTAAVGHRCRVVGAGRTADRAQCVSCHHRDRGTVLACDGGAGCAPCARLGPPTPAPLL